MPSLIEVARDALNISDSTAKPLKFYELYDRYFSAFRGRDIALIELGVHKGDSLKVWASYFTGCVIGVDLAERGPDLSSYPHAVYVQADQSDARRLAAICKEHAPAGLDIVIDDGTSDVTHGGLVQCYLAIECGGLYVVEDWATGYFGDWPDGALYRSADELAREAPAGRFPSHDFGMVGFVKSLIDHVAGDHIRPSLNGLPIQSDTVEFMHVYKTCAILKKSE
jgi:hypothetical protein